MGFQNAALQLWVLLATNLGQPQTTDHRQICKNILSVFWSIKFLCMCIYIYKVNLKPVLKHWNQLQPLEIHRQFNHDLNLLMTQQDPRVPRALFLTRLLPGGLGITSPTHGTADFQSSSRCLSWQPQIQILTGPTSSLVTSGSCRWLLRTGEETKQRWALQVLPMWYCWQSSPWLWVQLSTRFCSIREARVLNEWLGPAQTWHPSQWAAAGHPWHSPHKPGVARLSTAQGEGHIFRDQG